MNRALRRFPDLGRMSRAAAAFLATAAVEAVAQRGFFSLALSGGRTPRPLYRLLSQRPLATLFPWKETHLFWGDERFLPAGYAQSNFALAQEEFISKVDLPRENIHPVPLATGTPREAAEAYEKMLREFFMGRCGDVAGRPLPGDDFLPCFDLVLLGVGADGHTASLFPGDPALAEKKRWVVATTLPRGMPPARRVTLTLPVFNQARTVVFLAAGSEKQEAVRRVFSGEGLTESWPAAMVAAARVIWFVAEEG